MLKKKYKIAVSDLVLVLIDGKTSDESGKATPFKFNLLCKRLSAADLTAELENKEESAATLIKKITFGWDGQRLVLEDDDTPAAFCADALDAMLDIAGMPMQCLNAYLKDVQAKAKN